MASDNPLKNVFNDMPSLDNIKKDLKNLISYNELKKSKDTDPDKLSEVQPKLFNAQRQLKIPEKRYNSSPIKINIAVDRKLEKISIKVIAKLNKAAPEYTGVQQENVKNFLRDDFSYNDFYKLIERCIANFKLSDPDDFETIEQVLEKAGVASLDEFLEQIYVTPEFEDFIAISNKNFTVKDISKVIDDMVSSSKYGLPYFLSMMVSQKSPDGFKYSEIADDVIKILQKKHWENKKLI